MQLSKLMYQSKDQSRLDIDNLNQVWLSYLHHVRQNRKTSKANNLALFEKHNRLRSHIPERGEP
jgi:hypothetical protein